MPLERMSFTKLPVDDQDRALAFYRDVMGMEVQTDAPYEDGWRWIFLLIPGTDHRIHFGRRKTPADDEPVLALVSSDVDADCADWAGRGAELIETPRDAFWMQGVRFATVRDSEGNVLFVESWKG